MRSFLVGVLLLALVVSAQTNDEKLIFPKKFVQVRSMTFNRTYNLSYIDLGPSDSNYTFLFLHGQPTWSYLWRNMIKLIGGCSNADYASFNPNACGTIGERSAVARAVVWDMIGMGESEKVQDVPFSFDCRITTHAELLASFVSTLGLTSGGKKMILVAHDWGGGVAFSYMARHVGQVDGFVMGETYANFPEPPICRSPTPWFCDFRSTAGWKLNFDQNVFINNIFKAQIIRNLSTYEFDQYKMPFANKRDRWCPWVLPSEFVMGGVPSDLKRSIDTGRTLMWASKMPKLLLIANPGGLIQWATRNVTLKAFYGWMTDNTTLTVENVTGRHFYQEDSSLQAGLKIRNWFLNKVKGKTVTPMTFAPTGAPTSPSGPQPRPPASVAGGGPDEMYIYPKKIVSVWSSTFNRSYNMSYVDLGPADSEYVFVFLHGQPTYGYLWRNVIKYIGGCKNSDYSSIPNACGSIGEQPAIARAIVPDMIGMGLSEKVQDIPFAFDCRPPTHAELLASFISKLGLAMSPKKLILVAHDWGGGVMFTYLTTHLSSVHAVVMGETYMNFPTFPMMRCPSPVIPPWFCDYRFLPGWNLNFKGWTFFQFMKIGANLTNYEFNQYIMPYSNPRDRWCPWILPNNLVVGGIPSDVAASVDKGRQMLFNSSVPKLLMFAKPGGIFQHVNKTLWLTTIRSWMHADHHSTLTTTDIVGTHYYQEENPVIAGTKIRDWFQNTIKAKTPASESGVERVAPMLVVSLLVLLLSQW